MQEKSEVSSIYYIPEILEISDRYVCLDVLTVLSIFLPCLVVVAFENGGRGTLSESFAAQPQFKSTTVVLSFTPFYPISEL